MFDGQPESDGILSPDDVLARVLALARVGLFSRPFAAKAVQETFGVDVEGYGLAGREVRVECWTCDRGHVHKDISLAEAFRKAGGGKEPALSLSAALEQVAAESRTEPAGSLGLMNNAVRARYGHSEDGALRKIFVLQQAYDTGDSLTGNYTRPDGSGHRHCDIKPQHS